MSTDQEDVEFLWASGRFEELPLLELVQAITGRKGGQAWRELVRRDQAWSACSQALRGAETRIKDLQSQLTPRRIDEETPDGVMVWAGNAWTESDREDRGTWMCSVTSEYFDPQPTWWLPMLPAPEED